MSTASCRVEALPTECQQLKVVKTVNSHILCGTDASVLKIRLKIGKGVTKLSFEIYDMHIEISALRWGGAWLETNARCLKRNLQHPILFDLSYGIS